MSNEVRLRSTYRHLRVPWRWVTVVVVGATFATFGLAVQPWLTLALVPLVAIAVVMTKRPGLALPLLWAGLLVSDGYALPFDFVVPLSIGKGATVGFILIWLIHCLITRKSPVWLNPLSVAMLGTLVMLVVGLSQIREYTSFTTRLLVGLSSLCVLAHIVWTVMAPTELWRTLRLSAWVFVILVGLSMFVGQAIQEHGGYRSTGFATNPNQWATTLLIGTGLVLGVFPTDRTWRWAAAPVVAMVAVAMLSTVSRAGILDFVLLLPLVFWVLWRQRFWIAVVGVGTAVVLGPLVPWATLLHRFSSFSDSGSLEMDGSVHDRALLQRTAWEAFLNRPWFGLGTGAFEGESRYLTQGLISDPTHNTYLQVLAESGLIGAVFYAIPVAVVAWMIYRICRFGRSRRIRSLGLGFAYSFLGFAAMNVTMNGIEHATAYYVLGSLVALYRAHALPVATLQRLGLAETDEGAPTPQAHARSRVPSPQPVPRALQEDSSGGQRFRARMLNRRDDIGRDNESMERRAHDPRDAQSAS